MTKIPQPDTEMTRKEIHAAFGGRLQGAISPTKDHGIFVFLSLRHGPNLDPHLPVNAMGGDGFLHLLGEGNSGDQTFTQSNRALLEHKRDGRPIHVFASRTAIYDGPKADEHFRYLGQYEIDNDRPYYLVDSPDKRGQARRVIVFRLRGLPGSRPTTGLLSDTAEDMGIDHPPQPRVEAATRLRRPTAAVARESSVRAAQVLVARLAADLTMIGHTTTRLDLPTKYGDNTLTTDLVDATTDTMYEAKSSASREAVRSAVGYLLDLHRRPGAPANMAVLLPSDPLEDLRDFCAGLGIGVVWPNGDGGFTFVPGKH